MTKNAALRGILKKTALVLMSVFMLASVLGACTVSSGTETAPDVTTEPDVEVSVEVDVDTETEGLSFSLTTLTDETIDDSIISENKLTMVNFWATWCGPCVSEMPDLQSISEDYADKGFALVGVLFGDDDVEGAKDFIAEQGITYPVILPEGPFYDMSMDIYAIPTTMFFDSDGNQVGDTVVGGKSYEDWAGLIDLLLGQVS
jgi:thiol-disulfide isomerase/thioredoxin